MKLFSGYPGLPGVVFSGCLMLNSVAMAADDTAALRQVETFLEATDTISAGFQQVLLDENGNVLAESEGTMSIKRPGRFRWHYSTPDELLVLGDGKNIWSYDVELENVTVVSQSEALAANPASLLAGRGVAADAFSVARYWESETTNWVELVPREQQRDFRSIRLGFQDEALMLMELHDQLGQITRIVFSDVTQNSPVDDELFVFTVPAGVDVISAGEPAP